MKDIGYGKGYRYAHDEPDGYAAGERYFPEDMPDRRYYVPAPRGLEIKIGEALAARRARDREPARVNVSARIRRRIIVLDPKLLRSDLPEVAAELARRGFALDVASIAALEEQRKAAQIEADRLRAERNANAKATGQAKAQGRDAAPLIELGESLAQRLAAVEGQLEAIQAELAEPAAGPAQHPACERAARDAMRPTTWKCAAGASRGSSPSSRRITWRSASAWGWISRRRGASPVRGSW